MGTDRRAVEVVFASQTGTAQSVAQQLYEQLHSAGVACTLTCCSKLDLTAYQSQCQCLVIIIAATTGDGEPPDTARRLWRQLRKWSAPSLAHVSYTVLGLGDTNYNNFCNFGKSMDRQLQALGAHRFYACGWADDGTGLEQVVEPWCEGLISAIKISLSMQMPTLTPPSIMQAPTPKLPGIPYVLPHLNTSDSRDTSGGGGSTVCVNDDAASAGQGRDTSPHEHCSDLESGIVMKDHNVLPEIIAQFNIDVLPQSEIEGLPLKCCAFPLDEPLSLPALPAPYLTLAYTENCRIPPAPRGPATLPGAASEVMEVHVTEVKRLSHPNAVKTTLEFTVELPAAGLQYQPGDSFGVLVKNPQGEVELLLGLLGLREAADWTCELSVIPGTKKRAATVPKFLPHKSCLRHLLESCVDIRTVPKKPLLRALAEHTSLPGERRRLQELVSREGTAEYSHHVREAGLSILDLLLFFRSCRPPVTTLLEHLPSLLPRPYSVTSSPLVTPQHISFAFNVVEIPRAGSVAFPRRGVCTGWLASLAAKEEETMEPVSACTDDVEQALASLSLTNLRDIYIKVYLRNNLGFRPPTDPSTPVVMVGPGTGVAPFLGFLRHRQQAGIGPGEWWLFFGCRHRDRDFLYQNELKKLKEVGVLNYLIVSYSREGGDGPKYVQDNIVKHGAALGPLMDRAIVYVCGDARNMARDVFDAFVSVLSIHNSLTESEARKVLAQMQIDKRYLQDVWT